MMTPLVIHEIAATLIGRVAELLLHAAGGPVQLPRSNEDFDFY